MLPSHEPPKASHSRPTIMIIAVLIAFAFGFLFGLDYSQPKTTRTLTLPTNILAPRTQTSKADIAFEGFNATHLWSMRLADENYVRLARLMPCRNVTYTVGTKSDFIDACDHSTTSEYAVETSVRAQKWLFEYQNPPSCSDKRFAMIQQFAWSGFGSTVHQVVWAFGMAIADNRIAVYKKPGNWVSAREKASKSLSLFFRSILIVLRSHRSVFSFHWPTAHRRRRSMVIEWSPSMLTSDTGPNPFILRFLSIEHSTGIARNSYSIRCDTRRKPWLTHRRLLLSTSRHRPSINIVRTSLCTCVDQIKSSFVKCLKRTVCDNTSTCSMPMCDERTSRRSTSIRKTKTSTKNSSKSTKRRRAITSCWVSRRRVTSSFDRWWIGRETDERKLLWSFSVIYLLKRMRMCM